MFRLLPRDENFFDLFEQQAGHIVSASRVLEELTLDYPAAQAKVDRIRDLEHAGDSVTHEVVRRLNTTFVTPKRPPTDASRWGRSSSKTAEETDRAVRCLRTLSPQYKKHSIEVNRLENEADRLLRDELAALFEGGTDAIEVIKWKELYETMEAVTDRCEDVLNVIEGITLKMA